MTPADQEYLRPGFEAWCLRQPGFESHALARYIGRPIWLDYANAYKRTEVRFAFEAWCAAKSEPVEITSRSALNNRQFDRKIKGEPTEGKVTNKQILRRVLNAIDRAYAESNCLEHGDMASFEAKDVFVRAMQKEFGSSALSLGIQVGES